MDWDNDGDEDYLDGIVEGVFWMAPLGFSLLMVLGWVIWHFAVKA